jgi:phosphoenolpyruvate carboxylase
VHFAAKEIDGMLRTDVKLLGKILGSTIKSHDAHVFENVEIMRKLGREVFSLN